MTSYNAISNKTVKTHRILLFLTIFCFIIFIIFMLGFSYIAKYITNNIAIAIYCMSGFGSTILFIEERGQMNIIKRVGKNLKITFDESNIYLVNEEGNNIIERCFTWENIDAIEINDCITLSGNIKKNRIKIFSFIFNKRECDKRLSEFQIREKRQNVSYKYYFEIQYRTEIYDLINNYWNGEISNNLKVKD